MALSLFLASQLGARQTTFNNVRTVAVPDVLSSFPAGDFNGLPPIWNLQLSLRVCISGAKQAI